MTINTRKQAMAKSLNQTVNKPGTCQMTVRTWFNAPSAGDQDNDGDADAVDGWKSEPLHARHPNDRNPPPGVPLAFSGGSKGFGHRALSFPDGKVRSTDMLNDRYSAGHVSTVSSIAQIEKSMGVRYTGWSETIDGEAIPPEPSAKPPAKKTSRGGRVDDALDAAKLALKKTKNAIKGDTDKSRAKLLASAEKQLNAAVTTLKKIPYIK